MYQQQQQQIQHHNTDVATTAVKTVFKTATMMEKITITTTKTEQSPNRGANVFNFDVLRNFFFTRNEKSEIVNSFFPSFIFWRHDIQSNDNQQKDIMHWNTQHNDDMMALSKTIKSMAICKRHPALRQSAYLH
jgi:hypothetical protein